MYSSFIITLVSFILSHSLRSAAAAGQRSPIVEVPGGEIVGTVEYSASGRPYNAYRAVPYAESSIEYRLMPPGPVSPWHNVLLTNEAGPYCLQAGRGVMMGEEDCLHLSVYAPQTPPDAGPLPVLVWLHGGAFVVSGAADYDPTLMMDIDVVLVVPQYRLGFMGFIFAFDDAPGNYGLLDQLAALKWVKENIAQFGGDPQKVTLAGDDAGGASALYHMMLPKSAGLFHGVISLSGSPLNPWAKHPPLRRTMTHFADRLHCPRTALGQMIQCFKTAPVPILQDAQGFLLEYRDILVGNYYLSPSVQPEGMSPDHEAVLLQQDPLIALTNGDIYKVPVLLSSSKDVGNYVLFMTLYEWMIEMEKQHGEKFKDQMVTRIFKELGFSLGGSEERKLWDIYLKGLKGASIDEKLEGIAKLLTDTLYTAGVSYTASLLAKYTSTYLMRVDYSEGPHYYNTSVRRHSPPIEVGAALGDELNFILPKKYSPFENSKQKRISEVYLEIIENFINGRPPTPDWAPTSPDTLPCQVLGNDAQLKESEGFLPSERLEAFKIINDRHHVSALYKLGTPPPRDEL